MMHVGGQDYLTFWYNNTWDDHYVNILPFPSIVEVPGPPEPPSPADGRLFSNGRKANCFARNIKTFIVAQSSTINRCLPVSVAFAPIHSYAVAGDVVRLDEKKHGLRHIVGRPPALEKNLLSQALNPGGVVIGWRQNRAGRHGVDAHGRG